MNFKKTLKKLLLVVVLFTNTTSIYAVRPFITDDAAVVGRKLMQLETWLTFDKFSGQHWNMLTYGPYERLEVAVGAVYGYDKTQNTQFSFALPLIEAKFLFNEYKPNKFPGVAIDVGTFLPFGKGDFVPPGYGAYSYLAVTQCFGQNENVLIHGNLGVNYLYVDKKNQFVASWGLGTQIKIYKGLHSVLEIISGDPYVPETGLSYQVGVRYFISEFIQIDTEVGQGIAVPFWLGLGARFVMRQK